MPEATPGAGRNGTVAMRYRRALADLRLSAADPWSVPGRSAILAPIPMQRWLLLTLLLGCGAAPEPTPPRPEAKGAVETLIDGRVVLEAYAFDPSVGAGPLPLSADPQTVIAYYTETLASLGIAPGPLTQSETGRHLPPATSMVMTYLGDHRWQVSDQLPQPLVAARFADIGP